MRRVSRRTFARDAVIVAIGAPALAGLEVSEPAEAGAPKAGAPNSPEVEARIQWIFTKYGSRLNDAQRADIRRLIAGGQSSIDAMRAYPLDNSVGPRR